MGAEPKKKTIRVDERDGKAWKSAMVPMERPDAAKTDDPHEQKQNRKMRNVIPLVGPNLSSTGIPIHDLRARGKIRRSRCATIGALSQPVATRIRCIPVGEWMRRADGWRVN